MATPVIETGSIASVTGAAATAGTATAAVDFTVNARAIIWYLDVTVAATDVDDTLDVSVQTMLVTDVWVSVASFTQVLGNATEPIRHVMKTVVTEPQAVFVAGASLAAGSVRHIFGRSWRAFYVIVDPGAGAASFDFTVSGVVI